jgi:hypothetical protein
MTFSAVVSRMDAALMRIIGEPATLNGVPVRGVFEAPSAQPLGVASVDPAFLMRSTPLAVKGATLVIPEGEGVGQWRVRAVEPDGTGMVALVLEQLL